MNNYCHRFFLLLLALALWGTFGFSANAVEKTNTNTDVNDSANVKVSKEDLPPKKNSKNLSKKFSWHPSIAYKHTNGFRNDSDRENQISLSLRLKVNKQYSLVIGQDLLNAPIIRDESTWQARDTLISFNRSDPQIFSSKWNMKNTLRVSLPISQSSRRNDILSEFRLNSQINRTLKSGLSVSSWAYLSYWAKNYKFTPSALGGNGGNPLPLIDFGFFGSMSYIPARLKQLSFTLFFGGLSRTFERSEFANEHPAQGVHNSHNFYYAWGASASYTATKKVTISMGLEHSNNLHRYGGVYFEILDQYVTQWFLRSQISI